MLFSGKVTSGFNTLCHLLRAVTSIPHENRGHHRFRFAMILFIYLCFDLDRQYLPLTYYICGQDRVCLQKLVSFPFDSILSLLNCFRTKTNYCSIINAPLSFQVTATFFLPRLDVSFFRTSFLLKIGTSFTQFALNGPIIGMFLRVEMSWKSYQLKEALALDCHPNQLASHQWCQAQLQHQARSW